MEKQEQIMVQSNANLTINIKGEEFGIIMEALGFIRANLSNPLSKKIDEQVATQTRAALVKTNPVQMVPPAQ